MPNTLQIYEKVEPGFTIQDVQTGTVVLSIPIEPTVKISAIAEKPDPITKFENITPGMMDKGITGLTNPFSYTIT